jgi:hydrogenase maturation protease
MNPATLILGIGNDILTDDGIGPMIVHDLAQFPDISNAKFDTVSSGGLEIMEYIRGYNKVIFIDAIRTIDGKPGDIHYFKPSDFRETMHLSSLHDVGFLTALDLGKNLELGLPSDLHIIAIEIVEDRLFGSQLSPALQKKYPKIKGEVASLIKHIME